MRIIVSDTSCVIDLRKAQLLEAIFRLPYAFMMPRPLFDDELLSLNDADKGDLRKRGLDVADLDGEQVKAAQGYFNQHKALNLNDCFALALADQIENVILLTGDQALRDVAESKDVETHGVLWVTDQLYDNKCCRVEQLKFALECFLEDPLVHLPRDLIAERMRRYR